MVLLNPRCLAESNRVACGNVFESDHRKHPMLIVDMKGEDSSRWAAKEARAGWSPESVGYAGPLLWVGLDCDRIYGNRDMSKYAPKWRHDLVDNVAVQPRPGCRAARRFLCGMPRCWWAHLVGSFQWWWTADVGSARLRELPVMVPSRMAWSFTLPPPDLRLRGYISSSR